MKNNFDRGSSSILGIFLTSLLSVGLLYFIFVHQKSLSRLKERRDAYLCMKLVKDNTIKFSDKITLLNQVIFYSESAQVLTLLFPGTVWLSLAGPEIRKLAKLTQVGLLISFLNFIRETPYCSSLDKLSLAKTPFIISPLGFKRDIKGVTQLRGTKWQINILRKSLTLKSEFKYTSSLKPLSSVEVKETEGTVFWKEFIGFSF